MGGSPDVTVVQPPDPQDASDIIKKEKGISLASLTRFGALQGTLGQSQLQAPGINLFFPKKRNTSATTQG